MADHVAVADGEVEPMPSRDALLIDSVRRGEVGAYGQLYQHHVNSAYRMARRFGHDRTDDDDLVAEAFTRVLAALRAGHGPDTAFRAYLLTTLRHLAFDKTRRDRRLQFVEDLSGLDIDIVAISPLDTTMDDVVRTRIVTAFKALPKRWQLVLWHTEIEGQKPAKVAPLLGLRPNSVSALACRARAGLRDAYRKTEHTEATTEEQWTPMSQ